VHVRALLYPVIAALLTLNAGCAVNRATATVPSDSPLKAAKSFYVVQDPDDTRGIEKLIADNLSKRGLSATAGLAKEPPAGTDAVVTYNDKWMWDITMYMLELTIVIRKPQNNFPIASGNSLHTSLTRKSSAEMVDEVLGNIFSEAAKK
jgi:hypothetical protein